jgi:hypothetical protein
MNMSVITIDETTQLVRVTGTEDENVYSEVLYGWDTGVELHVPLHTTPIEVVQQYLAV